MIERRRALIQEFALRSVAVLSYLVTVSAALYYCVKQDFPVTLTIPFVSEAITLVLVLTARVAGKRDASPSMLVAAVISSCAYLLVSPKGVSVLIPSGVGQVVEIAGIVFALLAKLALGRSFGILPAQRGLSTSGPYGWVRHPIYLGYFVRDVAFVLTNLSIRNAGVMLVMWLAQVVRVNREEALLASSADGAAYAAYKRRVRYKLFPAIY